MKHFLLLFVLFLTVSGFAQEVAEIPELEPSLNAVWNFFGPAIGALLLVLFADASKHIKSGTWDTGIFIKTKAKPFIISVVLVVAVYYSLIYVPFLKPFLEVLAESELTEVTAAGLF